MLEIKTIARSLRNRDVFDEEVNKAIAEGWELVRRDIIPAGYQCQWEKNNPDPILYAELEREVVTEEEEVPEPIYRAMWRESRDPAFPLRCTSCGYKSNKAETICPNCHKVMENGE